MRWFCHPASECRWVPEEGVVALRGRSVYKNNFSRREDGVRARGGAQVGDVILNAGIKGDCLGETETLHLSAKSRCKTGMGGGWRW